MAGKHTVSVETATALKAAGFGRPLRDLDFVVRDADPFDSLGYVIRVENGTAAVSLLNGGADLAPESELTLIPRYGDLVEWSVDITVDEEVLEALAHSLMVEKDGEAHA